MNKATWGKSVRRIIVCLGLTLTLAASACFGAPAPVSTQAVADANTDFGLRLLQEECKTQKGNVFLSPFSVSQALTMTLNGAGGKTQAGMAQTLGLGTLSITEVNQANGDLLAALTTPERGVQLNIANALWASNTFQFPADFQQRVRQFYHGDTTTLDFGSPRAAQTINAWVKTQTRGKISALVSPNDLANSLFLLTDAVYFHGDWTQPFDQKATAAQPFHRGDGTAVTVPLMTCQGYLPYLETDQFQAVGIPYGAGRLRMLVFLPKPDVSLENVLQSLNSRAWVQWTAQMQYADMTLFLPRFRADTTLILNQPLATLGMASAFSGADFSAMGLGSTPLGRVIHKAVIEVNEEGTTAAAVTGVQGFGGPPPPPPITVRVDRPFVTAIQDTATGTLLFVGAIRDPQPAPTSEAPGQ